MDEPVFDSPRHVAAAQALKKLPLRGGKRFATMFQHGSLQLEVYAPRERDAQQPHDRDELYVIVKGTATYCNGALRYAARPGDFCFAAAGERHRFEDLSDDFFTWVLFYGPVGGERTAGGPAAEGAEALPREPG